MPRGCCHEEALSAEDDLVPNLSSPDFTLLHVALSLLGLGAGSVVLLGLLAGRTPTGMTALFLLVTLAANTIGLLLPPAHPGTIHAMSATSLTLATPTFAALHHFRLAGNWRWIYVAGAMTMLWLNALTAVLQTFAMIDYLQPLVGTPIITVMQLALFLIFAVLGGLAAACSR